MEQSKEKLRAIWWQTETSVIYRSGEPGEILIVRVPFAEDNRNWLQNGKRNSPVWIKEKKHWELPKAWFNDLVERILTKHHRLYVIQPYREHEVCAPACMNATGHECQCSCMGQNHGAGNDGSWFEVSDTFANRHGEKDLAAGSVEIASEQRTPRRSLSEQRHYGAAGIACRREPGLSFAQRARMDRKYGKSRLRWWEQWRL